MVVVVVVNYKCLINWGFGFLGVGCSCYEFTRLEGATGPIGSQSFINPLKRIMIRAKLFKPSTQNSKPQLDKHHMI